jgi:PAS domain S-box-containing protein
MPKDSAIGYGSRWAALTGTATAAAGVLVLIGWRLQIVLLVRPSRSVPPVAHNTAVGLILCGLGLAFLAGRKPLQKWSLACAALVALLAFLTLSEFIFHRPLGIDQIFGSPYLPGIGRDSGRMSPLTSLCLLLTAIGVTASAAGPRSARWPMWLAALTATLTGPTALTGLLNDLFGISTAVGWMKTAPMSPYTAGCFLVLCAGQLAYAWQRDTARQAAAAGRTASTAPVWAPYCIGAISTLSLLWLMNGETAQLGAGATLVVAAESVLTLLVIVAVPMGFKPKLALGLVMAVVIVVFTELYSFRALLKNDESQSWVVHTHVVLSQIDVLAEELAEAEAAVRGYMWTGQERGLIAWQQGSAKFMRDLTLLASLIGDNPRQRENLRQIHIALQPTVASIASRIETEQKYGVQAGLDAFRQQRGWEVLDPVETLLNGMRREEERLLRPRIAAASVSSGETKLVVVVGNAVALIFLAVLGAMAAAEMRGRVKEETFRGLLESAPDAMVVVNSKGQIVLANAQTETLFGYSREEILNHEVEMLVPPRFWATAPAEAKDFYLLPQGKETGAVLELYGRRKDGTEFPIELSLSPFEAEDGMLLSGAIRDITEHRRIEQQLKSQADALSQQAALLDVVPDSIFVRDMEGVISFWNRGAETTYGYIKSQALGKVSHELLQTQFSVGMPEIVASLRRTGRWEGELNHRCKDGSRIFVASRWVLQHSYPEAPMRVLEINNDITARKQADDEILRLNTELNLRIRDLTSINQELEAFTYTAAHDLRAPLRHMHGFAGVLRSSWYHRLDEDGRNCVDRIAAASRSMGQLLDDLLNFSRLGRVDMQMKRVDLSRMVEQIRQELEGEVKGRSVTWQVAELPEVAGDLSLLHQLLFNLVANAVKYTSKKTEAHIEIGSQWDDEENVTVFVRDNGAGFQMEYADKLFGVFQRLHKSQDFEGTGIGLAIVRRIVERHGGRAWAQGKPGEGATFFVSLPTRGHTNEQAGVHSAGG